MRSKSFLARMASCVSFLALLGCPAVKADETIDNSTVDVDGYIWNITGNLYVAYNRPGYLNIKNGGVVQVQNDVIQGFNPHNLGRITVEGSGSRLSSGGMQYVGYYSSGELIILDGGYVSNTGAYVAYSGNHDTVRGSVQVSGPGATWFNDGFLIIGAVNDTRIKASLLVERGGTVAAKYLSGAGSIALDRGTLKALATRAEFLTMTYADKVTLLAGGGTIDSNGFNIGISYALIGEGALTKSGAGTLTLSTVNDYRGGTIVNEGTLRLGVSNALHSAGQLSVASGAFADINGKTQTIASLSGAGTLNVNGGSVRISNGGTFGVISGSSGSLTLTGGTLFLDGASTYTGTTTVNSGVTLQIGASSGTTGSYVGDINNNGSLIFSRSNESSYAGVVLGPGSFSKSGAGTLTLLGEGSSVGTVAVNAGTLAFEQSGAFSAQSLTTMGGATTSLGETARLVVANAFTQASGAFLNVFMGTGGTPITAATASLDGALNLTGFSGPLPTMASMVGNDTFTLIHTTGGISGDFSSTNIIASSLDYLTLSGHTSTDGKDYDIGFGLAWLAGPVNGRGSFTLAGAANTFNVDIVLEDQSASATGWDGKSLTKAGEGTLILSAANTYTGVTQIDDGVLRTDIANAFAQSSAITIGSGATLDLNGFSQLAQNLSGAGSILLGSAVLTAQNGAATTFSGAISGSGSLVKTGAGTLTLSGMNSYSGDTTVSAGRLTLTGAGAISSAGTVDIASGAAFNIDRTTADGGNYNFANVLTGSGLLSVELLSGGNTFNFGSGVGAAFTGTVALGTGSFTLSGLNTAALANATLRLDTGNTTTVGAGNQTIGGLAFNGGTLSFDVTVPAQTQANGIVVADHLDLTGTGNVSVNLPSAPGMINPPGVNNLNLLSQDDDGGLVKLAGLSGGGTVSGHATGLTLVDQHGNSLSGAQSVNIAEGGNTVAVGTYDYLLNTGLSDDGLYVAYALTEVELLAGRTLTLTPDVSASGSGLDLSAMVTGSGNLAIAGSSGQVVSLSNGMSDYTGTTTVTSGTLLLGAAGAFGATSLLDIASGAAADINGHAQTVGSLAGAGTLDVNGGALTVSNGGTYSGVLTGAGSLTLSGGTLSVTGAGNGGLSAAVTIAGGATATLSATSGLGDSGTIVTAGALVFDGASGTLVKNVDGTGAVDLINGADVGLAGTNGLSGSWNLTSGTTLTASSHEHLGTASVNNDGSFVVDTATDWTLINAMSGSGTFTKSGGGNLTISHANSMTGPTTVSGGTLTLTNAGGVGTGAITISTAAGDATTGLDLAYTDGAAFGNTLSGSGTTTVSGDARITGSANAGYAGLWNITGVASVDTSAVTSTANLGTGSVFVTGTLNLESSGSYAFDNMLTGNGSVSSANGGGAFSFGIGVGSAFTGDVTLSDNTFDLSGNNTAVLSNAMLVVGSGNVTTVGAGSQTIGGLGFAGGTAIFDVEEPAATHANGIVETTGLLDATGSGTVQITVPSSFAVEPPTVSTELSIFEQDSANIIVQLVDATGATVLGGGGNLTLVDQNGNLLTNDTTVDLSNTTGGLVVAEGHYDYRLTTGPHGDGLYVNYGLMQIDLLGTGADALILTPVAGATGSAADLSAQLTGSGDLAIATGAGDYVSLSNSANDYTGTTFVRSGTLLFGNDNVLGQTDNLVLDAGTVVVMNGYSQSVGALNTASGSGIGISGTLTITDSQRAPGDMDGGSVESGTLFGNGSLVIDPSIVHVNGVQAGYTGTVTVTGGSQLLLNAANAFNNAQGIDLVSASDTLIFGDQSDYDSAWTSIANGVMRTSLSGLGTVQVQDGSDIALAGNNHGFAGRFDIAASSILRASQARNLGTATIANEGMFIATADNDWTLANTVTGMGTLVKDGSGVLSVGSALANFAGLTQVEAGTLRFGTASDAGVIGGSAEIAFGAALAGHGTIAGNVFNDGTVIVGQKDGFETITIAGHYTGTGSAVHIGTHFSDDTSATGQLLIAGDASGTTNVVIMKRGGFGKLTDNGIRIIEVAGISPGNAFTLRGDYIAADGKPVVIGGIYPYTLQYGGTQTTDDGHWYLVSKGAGAGEGFNYQPGVPLYEQYPQVLASLNTVPTLQERVGNRYWRTTDLTTWRGRVAGSGPYGMWGRIEGSRTDSEPQYSTTQAHRSTDLWKLQTGFDFVPYEGKDGSLLVGGINVSYGTAFSEIGSPHGRGRINATGIGVGATLTWYDASGLYVDGQVQTMLFDSDITSYTIGSRLVEANKGQGLVASVEAGFRYPLGNGFSLTPQAQLVWSRVKFDSFTDSFDVAVNLDDGNSLRGRLGLSLDYEQNWTAADGTGSRLHVYAIGNLYNEFLDGSKVTVANASFRSRDERLWAGIGLGGTYEWDDGRYALYGNVNLAGATRNMGDNHSFGGTVGFRSRW